MWWTPILAQLSKVNLVQLLTGINFQGVFNGVGLVYKSIQSHWRAYLFVALIGLLSASTYGWYRGNASLLKERAAHQLDISNFKQVQLDADNKAKAEREVLQKEAEARASQSDAEYSTLLAEYRANLVRYKASQSGTRQNGNHQLPSAQSGDGSSTGSDVLDTLTITGGDAQICATNTARLQAVRDWALNPPKDGQ